MKNMTQWGLAAGLAAALVFAPGARAQSSSTSGTTDSSTRPESGKAGSPGGEQTGTSGSSDSTAVGTGSSSTTGATGSGSSSTAGSGTSGSASSETSATGTASGSQRKVDKDLSKGLQELHAANQMEIQMGQMAQSTATNEQVKGFAQRMIQDHQNNDQQLQQLAQTMGVELTGEDFQKQQEKSQKDMEKVHGKQGAEFDAMYMEHMVKDHEKDVKKVKDLAKKAKDKKHTELATFLQTTHQKMQGHLQEAKQVEKVAKNEQKTQRRQATGASSGGTGSGSSSDTSGASGTGSSGGASPQGSETTGGAGGSGGGTGGSTSGTSGSSGSTGDTSSGASGSGSSSGGGRVGGGGGGGPR